MPNKLNNWIKPFFSLNKSEQRGIIVLILVIIFIGIFNIILPIITKSKSQSNLNKYNPDIISFLSGQKQIIDSLNIESLQNSGDIDMAIAMQKIKPVTFNPNKLPVEAWKNMGFTDKQIRNIKNYEAKGGKFKRKEDLKKMYSISDVEYEIIEPFISIPSLYKSNTGRVTKKKTINKKPNYQIVEVNSANADVLQTNLGLSQWLAKRIVSYKNVLGGYVSKTQIKEVYGLNDSIYNAIEKYISLDTSLVKKIDINNIEFKQLLKHPYFDYNTTKVFFNTRNKIGYFSSVNQLRLIDGINDSTINKVSNYLDFKPTNKLN
jgi:DNA uptake protein ComE-like DNA-binding protein